MGWRLGPAPLPREAGPHHRPPRCLRAPPSLASATLPNILNAAIPVRVLSATLEPSCPLPPAPRSCQQWVCPARAGSLRGTKPDTGTRAESEDERFSLGLSGPINGMAFSPLHAPGIGAVDPRDPEAGGPPAVPLTVLPRSVGSAVPRLGSPLPVPTACFVAQVHAGVEETSHGKQLLDVEEVRVLEGLTEDPVAHIWGGGRGCHSLWPPQLPTAEGSNTGVERGSEARQMVPLRETGLEPGADPRFAPAESRSSLHPERRDPAGFRGPSGSPQPPEDGPPIRSQGGLSGHLPRSQPTR